MRKKLWFRILATFTILVPYWILLGCVFIMFPIGTICGIGSLLEKIVVESDIYSSSVKEDLFITFAPLTVPVYAMVVYLRTGSFDI